MISKLLRSLLPAGIKELLMKMDIVVYLKRQLFKYEVKRVRKQQPAILKAIQGKENINVIFLAIHDAVWKYEELYRFLQKDNRFTVEIVVVPLVRNGIADIRVYNQTLGYFKDNGYPTVSSYDNETSSWLDIKELIQPDVVFFTNPHKLTFDQYYIEHFSDKLTCYVPYAFVVIDNIESHYNKLFHHSLWRYFVETKDHYQFSKIYNKYNPNNVIVTSFPGLDEIFNDNYTPTNTWKPYGTELVKKIIWAPHHTIKNQGEGLDYSSFMLYSAFFIKLLEGNKSIQMAFKPHPLLREKLYKDEDWGETRTNDYYALWDSLPNGQLEEGSYIDLFHFSDAMILDSTSFIVEYLYFDKPLFFTMRDNTILERFNSFGKKAFGYMYKGNNKEEISDFIEDVVIKKNDNLQEARQRFLQDIVLPKNKKTASENIYSELKKELNLVKKNK